MPAWATPEDALASTWKDASDVPTPILEELLTAAEEQCRDFAPALPVDDLGVEVAAPVRYRLAVIYQARELWAAGRRNGDVIAGDTYVVRARDLTASVRQLLRPRRGRPGIG